MRFRLTTRLPLKPIKAWFDLADSETGLDIRSLKSLLCTRIPQLLDEKGNAPSTADLELSIDEFALLDDSKISIIKENDLVWCVKKWSFGDLLLIMIIKRVRKERLQHTEKAESRGFKHG